MKIYSLEADRVAGDISLRIIFWLLIFSPLFYMVMLFLPSFVKSIFFSLITFQQGLPQSIHWVIFFAIPTFSFFFLRERLIKYSVIYLEEDQFTLKRNKLFKERINRSEILEIQAFRAPPLNIRRNLLDGPYYGTMLPLGFKLKNGKMVTFITRSEVLNLVKEMYTDIPTVQIGVLNRYTFILFIVGIFNIINIIFLANMMFATSTTIMSHLLATAVVFSN